MSSIYPSHALPSLQYQRTFLFSLGRLLHHLAEVEGLNLRAVEYLVLDEADRMFEMGFKDQVWI